MKTSWIMKAAFGLIAFLILFVVKSVALNLHQAADRKEQKMRMAKHAAEERQHVLRQKKFSAAAQSTGPATPVTPVTSATAATAATASTEANLKATAPAAVGRGMTWKLYDKAEVQKGLVLVGCNGCDAYRGDTTCDTQLPLLCLKKDGSPNPPNIASDTKGRSWVGGSVMASRPVAGNRFATIAQANQYCEQTIGKGGRVAEHHDGFGDWSFYAKGQLPKETKFWVNIQGQPANCWANR
ncbi:MAG: hypothetical protein V4805_07715 [Pseudomonadota bacterium]